MNTTAQTTAPLRSVRDGFAPAIQIFRGEKNIARVFGTSDLDMEQTAALFTSAPCLLKILTRIINRATAPMSNGDIDYDDVETARAIIARATA